MQTTVSAPFMPEPPNNADILRVIGPNEVLLDWSTVPDNAVQDALVNRFDAQYGGSYVRIDRVTSNGESNTIKTH